MAKIINDNGIGHANDIQDCRWLFSNLNGPASAGLMHAKKSLTFHVWTTSNSVLHTHENYIEIFIVTSGKLLHKFGDKSMVMKTGDAFLMFPGQYHQHCTYKNYTSQHINLTCSLPFAADLCKALFGLEQPEFPRQLVHLNEREFSVITNMQNIILRSHTDEHMYVTLRAALAFLLGFFYVQEQEVARNENLPKWLIQFLRRLQDIDFSDPVHLSDLYTMSGYSQSTLSMYFKKYMGQTLVSYINDLKMNHACNQLVNTNFSLTEIARSSGFESYPHFSRLFKTRFGLTPLQYRSSQIQSPK